MHIIMKRDNGHADELIDSLNGSTVDLLPLSSDNTPVHVHASACFVNKQIYF